ncbi:hypothetical protein AU255_03230 [Methyloprofundus sedimenti]|uniref:ParD-like antitoxin of type II toxin-antitoxin system n=1 Tax=Methyloprofundus sedimenti TaxID=1420851 RepID=A0A1V8M603_9GAMM|nr:hypothetical protein [Methyloprofundus sedimenti]OQK16928.1 hypothetical protein AU255_03230 [Methyloprofundus sedimenti]
MAKAASPIRLQQSLMQAAELSAKRFHRSTAEQIEYWADLGRSVSSVLDPDVLLSVVSGVVTIKTEPVFSSSIDPDKVFQSLENDRKEGALSNTITTSAINYQASIKHPGYLEQIDPAGNITTGQFENGQFIALKAELLEKR